MHNKVFSDQQLQLQGAANKFAWSGLIQRQTGKVALTVAGQGAPA